MKDNIPYKNATRFDITQKFGVNPQPYQPDGHTGVDMIAKYGTWLVAPQDVFITNIITNTDFPGDFTAIKRGYGLVMQNVDNPTTYYLYWHCLPVFPVNMGDFVEKGKPVAQMGNSGFVMSGGLVISIESRAKKPYPGTHVHYEKFIENSKRVYVDPIKDTNWYSKVEIDYLAIFKVVLLKMLNILK